MAPIRAEVANDCPPYEFESLSISTPNRLAIVQSDKPGKFEGMRLYKIGTPNGELVGMDGTGPRANSCMRRLEEEDLTVLMIDNVAPDQGATEILIDEVVELVLGSA